jgi:hypothetical protein
LGRREDGATSSQPGPSVQREAQRA